ncbi:cation transporter [Pseudarthrobacter sp. C4D7]|uniref:cation transporter n=1 Tax=Pseudarthrobacter sp. C4D7 TaxID=2735268 RepID=UPI0015859B76|nr:cation transporter [Pseudarthrobacter sp. C4D7]NUT71329.1 hypothetical protein [Pseudarthrobacter sp. C4D7]
MNIGNRLQLPLASSGCSCCAPAGAAEQPHAPAAPARQDFPAAVVPAGAAATTQRTFAVEGMTCGHCVRTVEAAVSAVAGVAAAAVDLVPGGRSRLAVTGVTPAAEIRQAVASAGYVLA